MAIQNLFILTGSSAEKPRRIAVHGDGKDRDEQHAFRVDFFRSKKPRNASCEEEDRAYKKHHGGDQRTHERESLMTEAEAVTGFLSGISLEEPGKPHRDGIPEIVDGIG